MVSARSFVSRVSSTVVRTVGAELRETKLATLEIWHWGRKHDWKGTAKAAFRRKYWGTLIAPIPPAKGEELTSGVAGWWFALALTTALSVALSSYHQQIVTGISPYKEAIR